jgi:hypothetical protein
MPPSYPNIITKIPIEIKKKIKTSYFSRKISRNSV